MFSAIPDEWNLPFLSPFYFLTVNLDNPTILYREALHKSQLKPEDRQPTPYLESSLGNTRGKGRPAHTDSITEGKINQLKRLSDNKCAHEVRTITIAKLAF